MAVWGVFLAVSAALPVSAMSDNQVSLSELLIDPAEPLTDAADEFIEIHNEGSASVATDSFSLRIGTKTYHLPAGQIPAAGYIIIKSSSSPLSLTNSGGQLDLLDSAGGVIDSTLWKTAVTGSSWAKINGTWQWTNSVTPLADNMPSSQPQPSSSPVAPGQGEAIAASILVTEALPDPAAPLSDSKDEFVELYNPNDVAVNIKGYVLKTGTSLTNRVILPDATIAPDAYYVVTSGATSLTLANAGSRIALFAPNGAQLGSTVIYPAASPGLSFALDGEDWTWTTTATPGSANILTAPQAKLAAQTSTASKPSASVGQSKASSSSKTAKSTTTPKSTKGSVKSAATKSSSAALNGKTLAGATKTSSGLWLLLALVGFTIAYVIYEFRNDLRDYYHKLRRHPVPRS